MQFTDFFIFLPDIWSMYSAIYYGLHSEIFCVPKRTPRRCDYPGLLFRKRYLDFFYCYFISEFSKKKWRKPTNKLCLYINHKGTATIVPGQENKKTKAKISPPRSACIDFDLAIGSIKIYIFSLRVCSHFDVVSNVVCIQRKSIGCWELFIPKRHGLT